MKSIACFMLAFGVICGAFGAHALKGILSADYLNVYHTAVFYHIIMSLALLLLSSDKAIDKPLLLTLLLGIILFSGSLYLLVIFEYQKLGMITPVGGILIIASLMLCAWRFRKE